MFIVKFNNFVNRHKSNIKVYNILICNFINRILFHRFIYWKVCWYVLVVEGNGTTRLSLSIARLKWNNKRKSFDFHCLKEVNNLLEDVKIKRIMNNDKFACFLGKRSPKTSFHLNDLSLATLRLKPIRDEYQWKCQMKY